MLNQIHMLFLATIVFQFLFSLGSELVDQAGEDGGEKWPYAQVPFVIESNFTTKLLSEFNNALAHFHQLTCIRFRHKTPSDKFFLKIHSGDGCWSYIGMHLIFVDRGQPLSLGSNCDNKGVILHEIECVQFHTHTSDIRENIAMKDEYIILNAQNIDQSHIKQFNKRDKQEIDLAGPYDLGSILHYQDNAFAVDPSIPTIVARGTFTNESFKMGQREHLSRLDVQKINRFYGCPLIRSQIVEVRKAIESGGLIKPTNKLEEIHRIHSPRNSHPKSFYWFKSADDFQTRTGKIAPNWLKFATFNDEARDYPRAIQCESVEESNCQDRSTDCLELALRGECERKPGYMLKHCRRSCCNCTDYKCFDTHDERKFRTLCLGRFKNQTTNVEMTACQIESTRKNALDFCPKSCFVCYDNSKQ